MSMVKQHRVWLLEVTLREQSSKFLIWVEGIGIEILLFELFVQLLTTLKELLNTYILLVSLVDHFTSLLAIGKYSVMRCFSGFKIKYTKLVKSVHSLAIILFFL